MLIGCWLAPTLGRLIVLARVTRSAGGHDVVTSIGATSSQGHEMILSHGTAASTIGAAIAEENQTIDPLSVGKGGSETELQGSALLAGTPTLREPLFMTMPVHPRLLSSVVPLTYTRLRQMLLEPFLLLRGVVVLTMIVTAVFLVALNAIGARAIDALSSRLLSAVSVALLCNLALGALVVAPTLFPDFGRALARLVTVNAGIAMSVRCAAVLVEGLQRLGGVALSACLQRGALPRVGLLSRQARLCPREGMKNSRPWSLPRQSHYSIGYVVMPIA